MNYRNPLSNPKRDTGELLLRQLHCKEKQFKYSIQHGNPYAVYLTVIPVSYTHLTLPTNREV